MLKLSLFVLLAVVLLMPSDAGARRWRVRIPRVIRTASTIYSVVKHFGRDVSATDVNGDGVMDASELTSMLGERATAEDVEELIHMVDDNSDGKMTRRELETILNQLDLE